MVRTEIKQGNSTATIVQGGDPKAATVKVKRASGTVIIHQRSGNSSATVIQMDGSAAERVRTPTLYGLNRCWFGSLPKPKGAKRRQHTGREAEALPRLPEPPFRRAVPTTPADRAGALVDCFPAHAAFPKWQEGRHPHCHFRGLLGLHTRYGPPDRSVAQGDLCHEAPAQPVTRPSRSSATRTIDNSLGGIFIH
jgi:hypothetical protein